MKRWLLLGALAACNSSQEQAKEPPTAMAVQEYTYPGEGFAIGFPRPPETLHGQTSISYVSKAGPEAYRVTAMPISDMGTSAADVLAKMKAKFPQGHEVTIAGAEAAFEFDTRIDGEVPSRVHAVVANGQIYEIVAAAMRLDESHMQSFFSSFRVIPRKP